LPLKSLLVSYLIIDLQVNFTENYQIPDGIFGCGTIISEQSEFKAALDNVSQSNVV
jgi:hypothetical protein